MTSAPFAAYLTIDIVEVTGKADTGGSRYTVGSVSYTRHTRLGNMYENPLAFRRCILLISFRIRYTGTPDVPAL